MPIEDSCGEAVEELLHHLLKTHGSLPESFISAVSDPALDSSYPQPAMFAHNLPRIHSTPLSWPSDWLWDGFWDT